MGYLIYRSTFNQIDMTATARRPDGTTCTLQGTWAWAPHLSWYDKERKTWVDVWSWEED